MKELVVLLLLVLAGAVLVLGVMCVKADAQPMLSAGVTRVMTPLEGEQPETGVSLSGIYRYKDILLDLGVEGYGEGLWRGSLGAGGVLTAGGAEFSMTLGLQARTEAEFDEGFYLLPAFLLPMPTADPEGPLSMRVGAQVSWWEWSLGEWELAPALDVVYSW